MLPAKVKGILDANLTGIGIAEKDMPILKLRLRLREVILLSLLSIRLSVFSQKG